MSIVGWEGNTPFLKYFSCYPPPPPRKAGVRQNEIYVGTHRSDAIQPSSEESQELPPHCMWVCGNHGVYDSVIYDE